MSNTAESFTLFCRENGLVLDGPAIMDGRWHRVPVVDDKKHKKSGSYMGFENGSCGWVTNFKGGAPAKWILAKRETAEERKLRLMESRAYAASARRRRKDAEEHAKARARDIWNHSRGHGYSNYILEKRIDPRNVRFHMGLIVIPVYSYPGNLISLQFIDKFGTKNFLVGSKTKGGCCYIGDHSGSGPVVVCEGWATGCTIAQITGLPVCCTFSASNMIEWARSQGWRYRGRKVIYAADDDRVTRVRMRKLHGPERSGKMVYGEEGAKAASVILPGSVLLPSLKNCDINKGATDFNDLMLLQGAEAVRVQFDRCLGNPSGVC